MKMLWEYIRCRRRTAALIAALLALFCTMLYVTGNVAGNIKYFLLLSAAVTAAFTAVDIQRFISRCNAVKAQENRIITDLSALPEPQNAVEREYQELLHILDAEKTRIQSESDSRYSDMLDYYTLWAHQIKTPLSAMRLILQSGDEPDIAELNGELFKTEQYVEMVLSYLRTDSESTDFVLKVYELDPMIKQCVRKYASQFIRRRISLVYDGTDATALTDEKWLAFVIEQLLSNALKYTYSGSIGITADKSGITVTDTGIGIAPEDLPRVCEKGYTGYNGRTDKKSTGIGLYLCKKILTKLGHELRISSEVGKGTSVEIIF